MSSEELNKRFETWYKEEALEYIPEDIPVSDFIQKVNIHEEYQIKQAIKSLDSASNFLSKKFEQLQGIKELKESK